MTNEVQDKQSQCHNMTSLHSIAKFFYASLDNLNKAQTIAKKCKFLEDKKKYKKYLKVMKKVQ